MNYQVYHIKGASWVGTLEVSIYATDEEDAIRQFNFRYGWQGYRITEEVQPAPVEQRRRRRELST
jgi:hypothetical protein